MGFYKKIRTKEDMAMLSADFEKHEETINNRMGPKTYKYDPRGGFCLYSWDNGASPSEYSYRHEGLYITSRQSLYLKVIAGPVKTSVEVKVPLTIFEATEWIKTHVPHGDKLNTEFFFTTFMSRIKMSTTLSPFTMFLLDKEADEMDTSVTSIIENTLLARYGFGNDRGLLDCSTETMKMVDELKDWKYQQVEMEEGTKTKQKKSKAEG